MRTRETTLITGGTGLIGSMLAKLLVSDGYRVIILTRHPRQLTGSPISYALWDIGKGIVDESAISSADHIIHLAGAGVADKRWTDKRKKEIVDSRVNSSSLLISALERTPNKVQTVVSASAIGWYGPDGDHARPFVETEPSAADFLGNTCRLWEESIRPVEAMGKRLVILRISIVLSNAGGAFPELTKTLKAGVASILGSGRQMISWIHADDLCRMFLYAMQRPHIDGVYNAAAPEPVTNKALVLAAARHRNRPYIPVHVPAFALHLALGEMSTEVLKSTTVDDSKIRNSGFKFIYPGIDAAMNELYKQ